MRFPRLALAALLLAASGCASSFVELPFGDDDAILARAAFAADGATMVEISFPERMRLAEVPCAMPAHARDFVAEALEHDGTKPDDATWWYLRSFPSPGYGTPHRGIHLDTRVDVDAQGKPKHTRYALRITAVGQDEAGRTRVMQAVAEFPLTIGGSTPQELCWRSVSREEVERGDVVLPRGCDCPRGSVH